MWRLLRQPSGFLPPVISAFLLALILIHVIRLGLAREADEGTEAHLFAILMPVQLAIISFFAISRLPRTPRQAIPVLVLQAGAALTVLGTVFLLHL